VEQREPWRRSPESNTCELGLHFSWEVNEMSEIQWLRDPDQGLKQAQATRKMALLDFSAAPM